MLKVESFSMCGLSGVSSVVPFFPAEYYPNSAEIKMKLFITYFMSMTTMTLQGRGEIRSGCSVVWTGSTPSQMFWLCSEVWLRVGRFQHHKQIPSFPVQISDQQRNHRKKVLQTPTQQQLELTPWFQLGYETEGLLQVQGYVSEFQVNLGYQETLFQTIHKSNKNH